MSILAPGTFKVSNYRKDIPERTKRAVLKRYEYDHRPPLQDRPYDTEASDFIPPQHDPHKIELVTIGAHDERSFGRKEGAAKTVTTAGSDANRRSKESDIRERLADFNVRMAAKAGRAPQPEPRKSNWPKGRKLRSRGFERRT